METEKKGKGGGVIRGGGGGMIDWGKEGSGGGDIKVPNVKWEGPIKELK